MLLRRISPMATFGHVGREMERLFNDYWPEFDGGAAHGRVFPPLNVWEQGDIYFVEAELPGMSMEGLEVEVLGNELTLKGRRQPVADESVTFHRRERGHGEFSRVLTLPADIDAEKVTAKLRDGILTISLPKAETAKARKIQVRSQE